jgi:hypothetical protein
MDYPQNLPENVQVIRSRYKRKVLMSSLKIILAGLISLTAICSLMYYFTLYPGPLSLPAVAPAPVTVFIQATPRVRMDPVHPTHTPKPEPTPKPTATPRPPKAAKSRPIKQGPQQIYPFGKPKATPGK